MVKPNKSIIAKVFVFTGGAGLLSVLVFMLLARAGLIHSLPKYINTLIFSGSLFTIVFGAVISGVVRAKGTPVEHSKASVVYWLLIVVYALIAFLILVEGLKGLV